MILLFILMSVLLEGIDICGDYYVGLMVEWVLYVLIFVVWMCR